MSNVPKPSFYNSVENVMKRSVIVNGFEQLNVVPRYENEKILKRKRKMEKLKTKGTDWFNLPATKKSEEINRDLEVLQMRSAINPKQFYKRSDIKTAPKYFQIGHIVESPLDYYANRATKKQRNSTIVDDLMKDAEFKQYTKRKYAEILKANPKLKRKAHKHARKLKRSKR